MKTPRFNFYSGIITALLTMMIAACIALLCSCSAPRLAAPSVDDLAGTPIYYGYYSPSAFKPLAFRPFYHTYQCF